MKTKETFFSSSKVYRPTWPNRIFPLLVTAGVVIFLWIALFFLTRSPGPARSGLSSTFFLGFALFSLALLLLGGLFCLGTQGVYILTAPEGLFYQSMGFYVYTPWKYVGDVQTVNIGMRSIDHLSLKREPITEMSLQEGIKERIAVMHTASALRAAEEAQPALSTVAAISDISRGRSWAVSTRERRASGSMLIPVGIFGAQWKTGELGDEINRYKTAAIYALMREKEQREGRE